MSLILINPPAQRLIRKLSLQILEGFSDGMTNNENVVMTAKKVAGELTIQHLSIDDLADAFVALNAENIKDLDKKNLSDFESYKMFLNEFLNNPQVIEEDVEYDGLDRMAAPPRDAYILTGNNKMGVKETKKGYALLLD